MARRQIAFLMSRNNLVAFRQGDCLRFDLFGQCISLAKLGRTGICLWMTIICFWLEFNMSVPTTLVISKKLSGTGIANNPCNP